MNKPWEAGALRVSDNGRYLQNGETPFFWLGDTAWLLFHRLGREEIDLYLRNRAGKGYSVIQTVAAMRMPSVNVYGQSAYIENDVKRPDTDGGWWELVDYGVSRAEELGLYIALLPVWGSSVKQMRMTPEDARSLAAFLTARYGGRPNVIWVNGGDTRGNENREFWDAMGRALKAGSPDKLVTFHPFGRTLSADYFPDAPWLDFDMFQSGHRRYDQLILKQWDDMSPELRYWYGEDNWRYVHRAFENPVRRPVLDAEPSYEHVPQGLHDYDEPLWTGADVRRYAYWSVLAGACGFTYGHCALMLFRYASDDDKGGRCTDTWRDALSHEGSDSAANMKKLITSLPWHTGHEATELLACAQGEKYERISAFAGYGFALFYTYTGRTIEVNPHSVAGGRVLASWYNPLTGAFNFTGTYSASDKLSFTPPAGVTANRDWLLVLKSTEPDA